MNMIEIYDTLRNVICPLDKVLDYIPMEGRILDIGSGYGTFSMLMANCDNRKILGIELDKNRVNVARSRTENYKNLSFISMDINDFDEKEKFDVIVCIDVLHHIPSVNHDNVLRKINGLLDKNGILVIKELDDRPIYKYLWAYVHDAIINMCTKFYYSSMKDMISLVKKNNFHIIENRYIDNMLYQHYILICKKNT